MKKLILYTITHFLAISLLSCEKDEGKLPQISFKTGSGYTATDATVAKNTAITIGINAAKTEKKDVLKTFDVSQSLDGATATSIVNESLSGSQGDNYSKDVHITTRNQAGTEKYTLTVINRDGLKNSVSLTLTVN